MGTTRTEDLSPFEVLFDHSEQSERTTPALLRIAGNLGFPPAFPDRPWVFANFVQSLDGIVSFGGDRPGGEWVSRSRHDRWMMDLLRAHADAVLCGVGTLMAEAQYGRIAGGPVYRIVDDDLLRFRTDVLRKPKLKNLIVTGSARLMVRNFRVFQSPHVDAWIITTSEGQAKLGGDAGARVIVSGERDKVVWSSLLSRLRHEFGIEYLLCEGGPALYGSLLAAGYIDEKFLTISPQEIGPLARAQVGVHSPATRPTPVAGVGFEVENAPWYRWISCRKAGDHEFNRYRRIRNEAVAPGSR